MPSHKPFCQNKQVQHPGDELNELEVRQDPRLLKGSGHGLAPGTPLREGIDNIIHARTGGLIVVAEPEEASQPVLRRPAASMSTTRPASCT